MNEILKKDNLGDNVDSLPLNSEVNLNYNRDESQLKHIRTISIIYLVFYIIFLMLGVIVIFWSISFVESVYAEEISNTFPIWAIIVCV